MSSVTINGRHISGRTGAVSIDVVITPDPPGQVKTQKLYLRPKAVPAPLPGEYAWQLQFSTPAVEIVTGWGYASGQNPLLKTKRLSAQGNGTAIVVQIDAAADLHRVYLLSGTSVDVDAPPDAPINSMPITRTRYFVEVDASHVILGPYDLDDGMHPAQQSFIDDVVIPEISG